MPKPQQLSFPYEESTVIGAFAHEKDHRLIRKLAPERACLRVIERALRIDLENP
jgi:hypothetical protein